ncbi:MAG TPA: lyase family protein, partial [Dictyoglomaceae bacterium]|nr:lyase family protein [Dictyoglomaceae bacterium]
SMMPHKRNPDVAELTRGKVGKIIGNLMDLFITLKALPLSYNRDIQEDKPLVFSAVDELKLAFKVWIGFLPKIEFHKENLKRFAEDSFLLATDLAEYLVLKGVPFREAHKIIGDLVRYCEEKKKNFNELKIDEWKTFSPFFEEDVFDLLSPEKSVNAKKTFGSPNPKINLKVLETKLSSLESLKEEWEERRKNLPTLEELLSKFL